MKVKKFDDSEATVIGHNKGSGRCAGMLGALVLRDDKGLEFKCEKLPAMMKGTPLESHFPPVPHAEETDLFVPLHEKWAPLFYDKFFELRGFYLKHGQAIANNIGELFPKRWQDEMQPMLDQVPAKPFAQVR